MALAPCWVLSDHFDDHHHDDDFMF